MASAVDDSYSSIFRDLSGGHIYRNREIITLRSAGTQTQGTSPLSVMNSSALFTGWVNTYGDVGISKFEFATSTATHFILSAAFENDSHDNASVMILPDGRLLCAWSKHSSDGLVYYRISTTAGGITSWGSERTLSVTPATSYNHLIYLTSTAKTYICYRSNSAPYRVKSSSDLVSWSAERLWVSNGAYRVYPTFWSNGVDRVDMVFQDLDVYAGQASVYHAYMQIDAGVEKFYKTDGTLIGTSGVTPADATRIYDGAVYDGWPWDIKLGADGHPRVLFTQFRSSADHRMMHGRWTGTSWDVAEITDVGGYLYADQTFSDAQACFDSTNSDIVYLGKTVSGKKKLQEWRTEDSGVTWEFYENVSSGTYDAFTPSSPRNHDSKLRVVWNDGTMTQYQNGLWSVSIKGV